MKSKASEVLNKIITALTSMARTKTLALKSKTRALKARLIIFSLLSNKKFLMSSLSHKLHNVLSSGHHHHNRDNKLKSNDDGCNGDAPDNGVEQEAEEEEDQAVVLYRDSLARHTVPDSARTEPVGGNIADSSYYGYGEDGDDEKYPDLTHSMFDLEETEEDAGGSVIDMVKNSKQEAGESFSLEEEIDHVADLFIKRFHRQMRIQKQQSFKEFQEMLQRGL